MTCYNKLRDGVADLVGKTFTPLYVSDKPLIHTGHDTREGKSQPAESTHNNLTVAM